MDESHKQNVKTEKKTGYILYEVKIESTLEGKNKRLTSQDVK